MNTAITSTKSKFIRHGAWMWNEEDQAWDLTEERDSEDLTPDEAKALSLQYLRTAESFDGTTTGYDKGSDSYYAINGKVRATWELHEVGEEHVK